MANDGNNIAFISSNNGGFQLIREGHVFRMNKRTSKKIYWRCTVPNCAAHLHTDTNNNFLSTTGEHNHLLEPENLKVKQFRTILKERVVNETMPIQKIYDEEMTKANFSSETLVSIPLSHHIRMNMIIMV